MFKFPMVNNCRTFKIVVINILKLIDISFKSLNRQVLYSAFSFSPSSLFVEESRLFVLQNSYSLDFAECIPLILFNMFSCLCISCIECRSSINSDLVFAERLLHGWWVVISFPRRHVMPALSINFLGITKYCDLSCLLHKIEEFHRSGQGSIVSLSLFQD